MESLQTAIVTRRGGRGRCDLSRCCPCLPSSWTKIQDWLHLVLVVGVLASLACLVQLVYELGFGERCRSPLCFKQWVAAVVVLPTTLYFFKTIGSYDEQLQEKKQRHEQEVQRLIANINEQVAEMNDLCKKVTENANDFATGRFNDKSHAFKTFLQTVKAHYADLYIEEEMLEQLRRLVIAWFREFAGTLINPRDSPLLTGAERELSRCTTVQAVCDAAMKRLEVKVVAPRFQMPADTPILPGRRSIEDGGSPAATRGAEQQARRLCGVSWLRLGGWQGCRRDRSPTSNGMPYTWYCGCGKLTILSRQHANLLCAFFADIFLILFQLWSDRWTSLVLVSINEVCVVSMLACFEQINEIAQLEQQIHIFEQRSREVEKRRDKYRNNWEKVQQLHDMWLYRTLPSLTIMGKVHTQLAFQDMDRRRALAGGKAGADPRPDFMRHANECLDCLQQKLGPLEDWRNAKDPLADGWKESVGRQLRDCESEDLEKVLSKLPVITTDLRCLDAPPPSVSPTGSFSSSSGISRP
mmetsp:Transcript_24272/g.76305  ORF Transcript_24272/g.76305 Transcript_24272/m.76305 type:complete len:525 (+) Transcript_24272:71-1645(+)